MMTAPQMTPGPWEIERHHVRAGPYTIRHHWHGLSPSGIIEANNKAIAALPQMVEALLFVSHEPEKTSLYDEEDVEGWRWTHPDGREQYVIGGWDEPPPMPPIVEEALRAAGVIE